ncbi:DNA repair protein RecO [Paenibacillus montaniterrae]|uniref:DNA repair protein RecO n=1 Tax=Paenibacillus montaniterrae TaxID=429341 RepID=A0A919YNG4_9BACL|nr:DNA repair protein RecO [Paenibacillus montaniterrae]GIP15314.1 DNA repair protein RecO [Paenibacillus montaniterrae]
MLYRVEGIVVRTVDYGENHKIVTLITNNSGKAGVLVRGARKVRSKHASLAQPFTYGEYSYTRQTGLGTLQHGELIASNHLLRSDLDLAAHASYIAELIDRCIADEEIGLVHFEQLKACFAALMEGKDVVVLTAIFEMKMLMMSGYSPIVEECIHCGNHVGPFKLSSYAGGIVCSRCAAQDASLLTVSETALKLLRLFKRLDLRQVGNINLSPETKQEVSGLIRQLIDMQLGIKFKTRSFLDNLGKLV